MTLKIKSNRKIFFLATVFGIAVAQGMGAVAQTSSVPPAGPSTNQQSQQSSAGAKIDPILVPFARGQSQHRVTSVFIVLKNMSEGLQAPTRYRHGEVVRFLRAASAETKAKYDAYLSSIPNLRDNLRPHRFYVSALTYSAVVTPEGLRIAASGPGVVKIYGNRRIERDPISRVSSIQRTETRSYPYDLVDIQLDQTHRAFPNLNGDGVILGSVDTGVEGDHPALKGKIRLFYDGEKRAVGAPRDTDSHGTHTIGTMVGDGQKGVPMGVAPRAQMIAAAALMGYDTMLEGMDFMLDPDRDPNTADFPRAINNSWHAGGAPDMELFYRAVNAWEASGILPVFSAGNRGPGDGTITQPKEHPSAFAVAATGENGKVTNFSSRGPAVFNGQRVEKPDLSAPGENILSSIPDGKYSTMSGTSMAAPHVTGATALLYQIDPRLTPVQVRTVLMQTTTAVDQNGNPTSRRAWNKVYGLGKLNVFNAVKMVQTLVQRRMGLEGFFEQYMASPSSISLNSILLLEKDQSTVEDVFAFPVGEEGSAWVPAAELF